MGDNMIKNDYDSNFPFIQQHSGTKNISMIQQQSTRPNTLSINTQRSNYPSSYLPNDYNKFFLSTPEVNETLRGYTTPDIINALTTQTVNDGQSSPGTKIIDEMFNTSLNNNHNNFRPMISTTNLYDPNTNRVLMPSVDIGRQETVSPYQISPRNRSISSSMNDNESSNSTTPSSPLSTYQHRNGLKDELQNVPSVGSNIHDPNKDLVKKEKKRERNRQAAQKCRTRKLTRIAELQKRVNELQGKNKDLTGIAESLQSDIVRLEKQLHDHHTQGCTLMHGSNL